MGRSGCVDVGGCMCSRCRLRAESARSCLLMVFALFYNQLERG